MLGRKVGWGMGRRQEKRKVSWWFVALFVLYTIVTTTLTMACYMSLVGVFKILVVLGIHAFIAKCLEGVVWGRAKSLGKHQDQYALYWPVKAHYYLWSLAFPPLPKKTKAVVVGIGWGMVVSLVGAAFLITMR